MKILEGKQTLLRIFVAEADRYHSKPLYQAIVEMLRREKLAGATVLRGISGFGAKSHLHAAHILAISEDLPMIIECVDTRDNIDRILPEIDKMVTDGLVTLEQVEIIRYAPKERS